MHRLRRRTREGVGFEFARVGFEFARGLREKVRGEYVVSSLMKQKKKAKNYAVFCFAGKKKLLFYIYAVIVKQKIYKRSTNHYFRPRKNQKQAHRGWHLLCVSTMCGAILLSKFWVLDQELCGLVL